MKQVLLVAAGGAAGATARFLLSGWVQRLSSAAFPWGTLTVNLLGCLAAGWLTGQAEKHAWLNDAGRLLLITGFLGGFTTFSAFSVDALRLWHTGDALSATAYVSGSVLLGLLACAAGFAGGAK